jgi:hypothetical protein
LKKRTKKLFPGASHARSHECLRRLERGSLPKTGVAQRREKFFGSFFQKRTTSLPYFSFP